MDDLSDWHGVARSGLLSDAMDLCGLPSNATGGFRLLGATPVALGRAVTMRQEIEGPMGGTARQGEIALGSPRGGILVIAMPANSGAVTWGEGHSLRAQIAGLAGVVVDGAIRDSAAIAVHPLPVLCRNTSPLRSKGRLVTAETGIEITVAGVRIAAGDIVCLDADGLVAVPAEHEAQVLEKAQAHAEWEANRDRDLLARLELSA